MPSTPPPRFGSGADQAQPFECRQRVRPVNAQMGLAIRLDVQTAFSFFPFPDERNSARDLYHQRLDTTGDRSITEAFRECRRGNRGGIL